MVTLHKKEDRGGFQKTTDFKWFLVGIFVFITIGFLLPTPQSLKNVAGEDAHHAQVMLALTLTSIIFFATEAIPIPGVAIFIAVSQILFGVRDFNEVPLSFAHDAVFFIAGTLAIASVLVKEDIDLRIGMLVLRFSGGSTKRVVAGIITMTALTTPFISEHAIAAIFLPIGIILYRISTKKVKDRNLGRLLMLSIAFGCNLGGPGAPTGGVRNVLMIGFMHEFFDIDVGFLQWMKYGIFYPLLMIPLLTYILLKIFKPQVKDMTPAIQQLREELEERGGMTKRQWAILGIFLFTLFLWVTDGNLIRILLGYRMGLGGIALLGALLYLIFGFASWDDYQRGIAWGVVLIYAGAISLGRGLISTGAGLWIAQITINLLSRVGMDSGFPLLFFAGIVTSILSNVMGSSGATVALLGPIILHLAEVSKTSLVGIGIGTSMASSFAFLFISGTPPNSIVYASGLVGARDFLKAGIPVFLVSLIVYVFIVGVLWRFIGLF